MRFRHGWNSFFYTMWCFIVVFLLNLINSFYCCLIDQVIGLVGRVFANGPWDQVSVASYQNLKKWYLISPCLTLSIIRYISRVEWSNQGGVAPSPTSRCSSICKGSIGLQSPILLTYRHLHILIWFPTYIYCISCCCSLSLSLSLSVYIYIYIYIYIYKSVHNGVKLQIY